MKALYIDIKPQRMLATRALAHFSKNMLFGPLSPLQEAEIPSPRLPGPGYVRIRNRLAGICGSDLHFVRAQGDLRIAPAALPGRRARIYMGHEIVGEVVEVGADVTELKVGDRVVQYRGGNNCLASGREPPCRQCAEGHTNRCEAVVDAIGESGSVGGGWSEEYVTRAGSLLKIPDDITDEQAVLIEPCGSGTRAALRRPAKPGDRVLVIGCGTQGLMTIQSIRAVQPDCEIAALAQFQWQADMASKMGAQHVIMLSQDAYKEVARLTGGHLLSGMFGNRVILGGFDQVYDAVGRPETVRDALRWTRGGGCVIIVGVYLAPMHIDLTPVWYNEVDLLGVMAYGEEEWQGQRILTFELIIKWLQEGKLNFDGIITHRFPLSRYREALLTALEQPRTHAIKVVFEYPRS
jgi:2-desacetyl-2-hydroxyethyl bacteriochlorophyllide A dehydrogenase